MFDVKCVVVNCKVTEQFVCDFTTTGISNDMILVPNTEFKVKIDGELHTFPANTAFFYPKFTPFYYTRTENEYIDYFIHFTRDKNTVSEYTLPVGQPIYLNDPKTVYDLIRIIASENWHEGNNRSEILNNLMKTLFLKIMESTGNNSPKLHYNELYGIRSRIYLHPEYDWSLESISEVLHMSHNNIHRLYKEYFDTTFLNDVIASRLRQSKDYLSHTNYSINTISEYCGYKNVEHFCRQFKKHNGITPKEYRQQNSRKAAI